MNWRLEEIELLKNEYLTVPTKDIQNHLNRTGVAIGVKARRLGLHRNVRIIKWSKKESDFLKENYLECTSKELGKMLNKSKGSIDAKLRRMKLNKLKWWTKEEIEILKKYYPSRPRDKVKEKLKPRSWASIKGEAKHLGIHREYRGFQIRKVDDVLNNLSDIDKAYLAGFIDGEGCICFLKQTRKNRERYTPCITIVNTNKEIIEWINGKIPYFNLHVSTRPKNHKDMYIIETRKQMPIKYILQMMIPYLKVKKEQAELMLEYINNRLSGVYVSRNRKIYHQLKELNRRGK